MTRSYGPWTTSLGATGRFGLSSFLRRRIIFLTTARNAAVRPRLPILAMLFGLFCCVLGSPSILLSASARLENSSGAAIATAEERMGTDLASVRTQTRTETEPGVVTAICLDEQRQPMEGVKVQLVRIRRDGLLQRVSVLREDASNAEGVVALDVPPMTADSHEPLTYELRASAPGFRETKVAIPMVSARSLELMLKSNGPLHGRILDVNGLPIAGATIWMGGDLAASGYVAESDRTGRYSFAKLQRRRDSAGDFAFANLGAQGLLETERPASLFARPLPEPMARRVLIEHPDYLPQLVTVDDEAVLLDIQLTQRSEASPASQAFSTSRLVRRSLSPESLDPHFLEPK